MLDRDEDMMVSGTRHPFLGKYKVGFTKEGKITACDIEIYNNGGHTLDLSPAVSGIIGSILGFFLFNFSQNLKIRSTLYISYIPYRLCREPCSILKMHIIFQMLELEVMCARPICHPTLHSEDSEDHRECFLERI